MDQDKKAIFHSVKNVESQMTLRSLKEVDNILWENPFVNISENVIKQNKNFSYKQSPRAERLTAD